MLMVMLMYVEYALMVENSSVATTAQQPSMLNALATRDNALEVNGSAISVKSLNTD
jgi:hypothetical protein